VTIDEMLAKYPGRVVCDFRAHQATGNWEIYGGGGVWMDTDEPFEEAVALPGKEGGDE